MRKKILIVVVLIIGGLYAWWYFQAPVASGVYPQKHVGLEMVEVEEDQVMVPINLEVRWIKAFPWEKPPVINEISFFDESNRVFAALGGEIQLHVPGYQKWYERNVGSEIQLYLNGASFAEPGSVSTTAIENKLSNEYQLDRISIVRDNKRLNFPIEKNYVFHPIHKNYDKKGWSFEGLTFLVLDHDYDNPKGLIVNLKGNKGHTLERIGFWLPGMTASYLREEVQYNHRLNMDSYLNTKEPFDGKQLQLPYETESTSMLIYFPFTEEMLNKNSDTLVRLMPYFQFSFDEENYIVGGNAGSIGNLQRQNWKDLIYLHMEE